MLRTRGSKVLDGHQPGERDGWMRHASGVVSDARSYAGCT